MEDLNGVPRNIRILLTIFIPNSKSHFSKLEKKIPLRFPWSRYTHVLLGRFHLGENVERV